MMGLHLSVNAGNYEPIAEGTHTAVCDRIIDLGRQVGSEEYGGKISPKVYIGWLVTDEMDENMNPKEKCIGRIYTASLDKKSNLRKDLEAWRGKPFSDEELQDFDLDNVLGTGCMLNVVHVQKNDKPREQINGIVALPRGMKLEPPAETLSFVLDEATVEKIDERIPNWLQDMIRGSVTYQDLLQQHEREQVFGPDDEGADEFLNESLNG